MSRKETAAEEAPYAAASDADGSGLSVAALRSIVAATAGTRGAGFFRVLVKHLAQALGVRWAYVADLQSATQARTLAVWDGDGYADDFAFDVEGSPSAEVAARGRARYFEDAQGEFPSDPLLRRMGAKGYVCTPLRNGSPKPLGLLIAMHDGPIEEPELASDMLQLFACRAGAELACLHSESALRAQANAHRDDLAHVSDIIFSLDPRSVLLSVSPAVEQALGYRPEELVGRTMAELGVLTPDSLRAALQVIERLLRGEETPLGTYELIARDGSQVFGEISTSAVRENGEVVRLVAVARNVTDRVHAERALRTSEQLTRYAFEQAAVGIVTADVDSKLLLHANQRACEILGYTEADLRARTYADCTHPEDLAGSQAGVERLLRGEAERLQLTKRYLRKDGSIVHCEVTISLVRDRDGKPLQLVAVLEDVTERREARQQLARLAAAVEHAAEDIFITDVAGRITYVNPAFERVTGYAASEVQGRSSTFLRGASEDPRLRRNMLRALQSTGVWSDRVRTRCKDGSEIDQDVTVKAIFDTGGEKLGYVVVRRDVTEQLELEAQVRQAQKLEAIGTLAGGIAHDFNNLLAPIIGYADMTLERLEPGTRLHKYQSHVAEAASRATDLVRQILTFSRRTEQERQPTDLRLLLKEMLKLMRASLPATIDIGTQIDSGRCAVLADPTQLHQIVMNLTTNAAHAMRERGGVLEYELATIDVDEALTRRTPDLATGRYVRLTVRDTGCGMDAETRLRIFEPFFTTKAKEEGTGLGLSVVHGIVRSHAGAITVESAPDEGATFRVYLPQHAQVPARDEEAEESIPGGAEHILLVDDEQGIAEFGRLALGRLGYEVTACESAHEALAQFRRHPERFDLVLTDLTMPSMTGVELAAAIHDVCADMPIVVMTGSSPRRLDEALARGEICGALEKPARLGQLARAVRQCLDQV